jgi:hypothetical protein
MLHRGVMGRTRERWLGIGTGAGSRWPRRAASASRGDGDSCRTACLGYPVKTPFKISTLLRFTGLGPAASTSSDRRGRSRHPLFESMLGAPFLVYNERFTVTAAGSVNPFLAPGTGSAGRRKRSEAANCRMVTIRLERSGWSARPSRITG